MNDSFGTGAFGTLDAGEKGLEGPSFTVEDLQGMRIVFKAFEERVDAIDLGSKKAVSKPGLFIVDLLRESQLSKDTAEQFTTTLDSVLQVGNGYCTVARDSARLLSFLDIDNKNISHHHVQPVRKIQV